MQDQHIDMQWVIYFLVELVNLLIKKNAAYGGDNIVFTGQSGIATRLIDKAYRFRNLVNHPEQQSYESKEDTLTDIVGYCFIGMMLASGKWGNTVDRVALEQLTYTLSMKPHAVFPDTCNTTIPHLAHSLVKLTENLWLRTGMFDYDVFPVYLFDELAKVAIAALYLLYLEEQKTLEQAIKQDLVAGLPDFKPLGKNEYLDLPTGLISGRPDTD